MDSERNVSCNCAHIPPTMPVYRDEHLIDCPVRVWAELADVDAMSRGVAEAADLMRNGDMEGLIAFAQRNSAERGRAAHLRAQARLGHKGERRWLNKARRRTSMAERHSSALTAAEVRALMPVSRDLETAPLVMVKRNGARWIGRIVATIEAPALILQRPDGTRIPIVMDGASATVLDDTSGQTQQTER